MDRLLQEKGALTTINLEDLVFGRTALHITFEPVEENEAASEITKLLLLAGANPFLQDSQGRTPLQLLQQQRPNDHASKRLLQEAMADGGRTFFLHRVRYLSDVAHILAKTLTKAALTTFRPRLPRIKLAPTQRRRDRSYTGSESEEEIMERQGAVLCYVLS